MIQDELWHLCNLILTKGNSSSVSVYCLGELRNTEWPWRVCPGLSSPGHGGALVIIKGCCNQDDAPGDNTRGTVLLASRSSCEIHLQESIAQLSRECLECVSYYYAIKSIHSAMMIQYQCSQKEYVTPAGWTLSLYLETDFD